MKDYNQVVNERFDKEENPENSIYAPDQAIGKYSRSVVFSTLKNIVDDHFAIETRDRKSVLDVGCGNGGILEQISKLKFSLENLKGVDLSIKRIEYAKSKFETISFEQQDILKLSLEKKDYDFIVAFDLFSHLKTENQLLTGLRNVAQHLDAKGVFLWYDIYSQTHYSPSNESDCWGFNENEIVDLAVKSGFEVLEIKQNFKLFFNKYHSLYQVRRFPLWFVKLMEKIIPGKPGNLAVVLKKKGE